MSKHVTSLRTHLRIIAPAGNAAHFEEMSQRWQAVDKTVSNFIGTRSESQTSRIKNEHVITRPLN